MSKFLILYESDTPATEKMANATPEQVEASMKEWIDWREEKQKAGAVVDFGMPLEPRKHIASSGEASDSHMTKVSGYAIVEADSLDAVLEILKSHPHLKTSPDCAIEVLEFLSMPGLEDVSR